MSAGGFFEFLRPAALVLSALLSVWVLASARRYRLQLPIAFAWALGTFIFPFIAFPIFLIVRSARKRAQRDNDELPPPAKLRYLLPLIYGVGLLSILAVYLYRDYRSVDAHLARAVRAKVMNEPDKAIREYQAALKIEDNAHTHKLLANEFAETGKWEDALREFRAAEKGGEADDTTTFGMARALEATGHSLDALGNYEKFLAGAVCSSPNNDPRCEKARERVATGKGQK